MDRAVKQLFCFKRLNMLIVMGILWLCLPMFSIAAEQVGSCGENLKWELSDGSLTISGSGNMTDYEDNSMAPWYEMAEEIQSISLPSGLTSISDFAFYGCKNLTNINIPNSVTSIGDYAFAECTRLLQVNLGSVQTIGKGAFQRCESLSSISFPATLTSIESKAFYRCYGLRAVTIPSSVTNLGASTFAYCEGLVRATVNAQLETLPVWTFYGCSNLTDVSLASQISSAGEYAFQYCENLNGIYIQDGDEETALKIEQSISQNNSYQEEKSEVLAGQEEEQLSEENIKGNGSVVDPFVVTHDMPNSSIATSENENIFTSTTVIQKGNLTVSVKEVIDRSDGEGIRSRRIDATVENSEEWASVVEVVDEEINSVKNGDITVEIQLVGNTIEAENLILYAGKSVTLNIKLSNGVIWKLDMSKFSEDDFSGTYDLGVKLSKTGDGKTTIGSDNVYTMKFEDHVDFNVTVGINQGRQYDKATLFVKEGSSYELISTMIVDQDSYAWFSLAGVDKNAKYYIGMNVEKITAEDATIPETMYSEYDLEENGSYLMDEDGMQYRITGRSSRWGITGKQFAIYVGVAIAATVLIVGFVMVTMNIIKKSREKYERMVEEAAQQEMEEEEALRMEIMKELLGESDDSIKRE